ncbi:hypothetical protein [Streptomyces cyaneofuscatus]|uniref:hypothetical protein n=1 Tax=Streptomyces cyaneofuscatus TaxID=66883 RepID=UPI0036536F6F
MERLSRLREDEALTAAHVRTVAEGLEVSERTVWRWLAPPKPAAPAVRPRYELSEADRAALAFYQGNVAAMVHARRAVTDGDGTTAGAPVPAFLAEGWAKAKPVPEHTLYRAFTQGLTPAERAAWKSGEAGRRAGSVYLRRPDALRGRCWEMDHKQLLILVLPPKGKALAPWLTIVVDDGTRALLGWAIATAPTSGTVLSEAIRQLRPLLTARGFAVPQWRFSRRAAVVQRPPPGPPPAPGGWATAGHACGWCGCAGPRGVMVSQVVVMSDFGRRSTSSRPVLSVLGRTYAAEVVRRAARWSSCRADKVSGAL